MRSDYKIFLKTQNFDGSVKNKANSNGGKGIHDGIEGSAVHVQNVLNDETKTQYGASNAPNDESSLSAFGVVSFFFSRSVKQFHVT